MVAMSVVTKFDTVGSGPGFVTSAKETCTPSAWSSRARKLMRPPLPSSGLIVMRRPGWSAA